MRGNNCSGRIRPLAIPLLPNQYSNLIHTHLYVLVVHPSKSKGLADVGFPAGTGGSQVATEALSMMLV